jgi:virginiamycin B lyase
MNISGRRSRLVALLTAMLVCICLLSLSTAPAWAKVGTITEFPIPPAESDPEGITAGPDGNLWFTLSFGNSIGRITTGGSTTLFALPRTCQNRFGCQPEGITAGPVGNVWFAENRGDKIGRITTQ